MKRNKKRNRLMLLLILLLAVSIGYALLSTTLKINGSTTITKNNWSVYWDNVQVESGSVDATTNIPAIGQDTNDPVNTKVTWSTTLSLPGDYYEFTVDATNAGTVDAMITSIDNTVTPSLPEYIKYSVTYADGTAIANNHLLAKKTGSTNTTEKYKVRVEFLDTVTPEQMDAIPAGGVTYTFTYGVTYGQANDEAIEKPTASAWTLPNGKTANTLSIGDEICTGDQCFNFIRYDGNDVVMLAKYNLKVGNIYSSLGSKTGEYTSSDEGYGLQSSEARGYVSGETRYGTVAFSATNYWNGAASYPIDVYDATNYKGAPGEANYSVAYYVEQYKTKLTNDYHATIKDARLLTYAEATDSSIGCDGNMRTCPTNGFITNTTFWLGSAGHSDLVWHVVSVGDFDDSGFNESRDGAVRPVIVIDKANL